MRRQLVGSLEVLAALASLTCAGCAGTAVMIARTPNGGVLSLDGDHDEAMADARRQMSDACAGAYSIVRERDTLAAVYHGRPLRELQVEYACGAQPDSPSTSSAPVTPVTPATPVAPAR